MPSVPLENLGETRVSQFRRILCLMAILCCVSAKAFAERPQGLLWHRTGLAATLPLQVKTEPGSDYLLELLLPETGEAVLGAYIRGGAFFRVLVPPGQYTLLFSSGAEWRGEVDAFGPETRSFALYPPLAFGATFSRMEGHLVDLRDLEAVTVEDFAFCQRSEIETALPERLTDLRARPDEDATERFIQRLEVAEITYDVRTRVCD